MAGDSGAEWSLFWPGKGIAEDSWALVIGLLVRPAVASNLASFAGVNTEAAGGTEVSAVLPAATGDAESAVADGFKGGVEFTACLLQPPKTSSAAQKVTVGSA